jgi:hypothetical protein
MFGVLYVICMLFGMIAKISKVCDIYIEKNKGEK